MKRVCPVCSATEPEPIECRQASPVMMNRLHASAEAARSAPRGTLDIVRCRRCGFAWNRAFDPALIAYDDDYENDQSHSPTFLAHVKARARDVVEAVPAGAPIDYLEIGCGQGGFIGEVVMAAVGRLRSAEGFDPAWRGQDGEGPHGSRIHKVYFDEASRGRLLHAPNVVASRHTIEHVPDPLAFLIAIRRALGPESKATLFLETPCFDWIVRNGAFQDLFYEHCSIFTADSLRFALETAGFGAVTVRHVFDGQYLWAEGSAAVPAGSVRSPEPSGAAAGAATSAFAGKWRAAIAAAREKGPVGVWGAGAKGVTFVLLADPDLAMLDCAIDINPGKQGLFLPGSGLEVVSPEMAVARGLRTIFVMNPNYLDEISRLLASLGSDAALVPIN